MSILASAAEVAQVFAPVFAALCPPGHCATDLSYLDRARTSSRSPVADADGHVGPVVERLDLRRAEETAAAAAGAAGAAVGETRGELRVGGSFALISGRDGQVRVRKVFDDDEATIAALTAAATRDLEGDEAAGGLPPTAAEAEAAATLAALQLYQQQQSAAASGRREKDDKGRRRRMGGAQMIGGEGAVDGETVADSAGDAEANAKAEAILVPDADTRHSGVVRMFNAAKGFGFLQAAVGGPDIYVSASAVVDVAGLGIPTLTVLCAGEPVEFCVTRNTQANATRKLRALRVTGPKGTAVHVQQVQYRRRGVVRYYTEDKQYGFIVPDDDGEDVFFHASQLLWDQEVAKTKRKACEGFIVEFSLQEADNTVALGRSDLVAPAENSRAGGDANRRRTGAGDRKIAFAITDADFRLLDPETVPRSEVSNQRDGGTTERRKREREQEAAEGRRGPLLSGFTAAAEECATW